MNATNNKQKPGRRNSVDELVHDARFQGLSRWQIERAIMFAGVEGELQLGVRSVYGEEAIKVVLTCLTRIGGQA